MDLDVISSDFGSANTANDDGRNDDDSIVH